MSGKFGRRKTEDGRRKTEDRSQKTEDEGQKLAGLLTETDY